MGIDQSRVEQTIAGAYRTHGEEGKCLAVLSVVLLKAEQTLPSRLWSFKGQVGPVGRVGVSA